MSRLITVTHQAALRRHHALPGFQRGSQNECHKERAILQAAQAEREGRHYFEYSDELFIKCGGQWMEWWRADPHEIAL